MKYIFITGISTGIGYHLCKALLAESFFVIGSVRNQEDKLKLESEFDTNFKVFVFDVCDSQSIELARDEVKIILGEHQLFALINNAGIAQSGPLLHVEESQFIKQMDVNVNGIFRVTNAFFPLLKSKDENGIGAGRIINISSISGLLNTPFMGAYCISKHAVESMSDIYRRELDIYGIKLIIIEPGPIKSEIWLKSLNSMEAYQSTDYWPYLKDANRLIKSTDENALEPEVLSKVIIDALNAKNPKHRYIVHKKKWFIYFIHHLLPSRWMDMITRKKLNKMKMGESNSFR